MELAASRRTGSPLVVHGLESNEAEPGPGELVEVFRTSADMLEQL